MLDKNKNRTYSVVPYDPAWVVKFGAIEKLLVSIFGEQALSIEHIGSISVPDMKAKPVIDILVVVERMQPFLFEKEKMVEAGYEWGTNYIASNTLLFYKTEKGGDQKVENIHVLPIGSQSISQFLDIRDFLRAHSVWAEKYGNLKERLNIEFPGDYLAYREDKQDFLKQLQTLAKLWRSHK